MRKLLFISLAFYFLAQHSTAQVLGEPIVTWDFANGIPSNWISGINSTSDIAHWEYRGPNTTPDYTVGARGSCSGIAQPLTSVTQSNGFVIFDGNYWDDPGTECGAGLGTGVDPAPHTAWLITDAQDFSMLTGAVLTFQQQYRSFTATTKVQISVDGGTLWTDIFANTGPQSPNSEWRSVDITEEIIGQSSVQFKFIYQGTYYWWLLDDITVYQPNENDLMIGDVRFTDNTGPDTEEALLDLEYDQYPVNMIPEFNFGATATNIGVNTQHNTLLNVRIVRDETTEIYNQDSPDTDIPADAMQELAIAAPYTNTAVLGDYEIFYALDQDESDDTYENNIDSLDYSITPYTYARDEGPTESIYVPTSEYAPYLMEAGTYYQGFNGTMYCHSIPVAVGEGTEIGAGVRAIIYNQAKDIVLAMTDTMYVNYADLNGIGDENMMVLHLPQPFHLLMDSVYFVAIAEVDSSQAVYPARSGLSEGETSLVRLPSINATLTSPTIPMVRMNVYTVGVVSGCTDNLAMNYNASAGTDDGSCLYPGCTHDDADNYDPTANYDDGSCVVGGCADPEAANYQPGVDYDNGSCQYPGCTDQSAVNYDPTSNLDDGSCEFLHPIINIPVLSGCAPFTFTLTNQSDVNEGTQCEYTLNDDIVNNECVSEFSYTIETAGVYELTYTLSENTAMADTTITIEVYALPEVPELLYNNTSYTVECINCAPNDYEWIFEDADLSASANMDLNIFLDDYYQNGYYRVTATTEHGCSAISAALLVIQPYFMATVSEGCTPLTVTVNDLGDDFPGIAATLNFDDSEIVNDFSGSASHTYNTAGSYNITLTWESEEDAGEGEYELPVSVFEAITPQISYNSGSDQVECANCNEFTSVEWNIDGTIFTGNGPFDGGSNSYLVTGTTSGNCSGTSLFVLEEVSELLSAEFSVYPNPADNVVILTNSAGRVFDVNLYDTMGRNMQPGRSKSFGQVKLETGDLASGLYTLVISVDGNRVTRLVEISH